MNKLFFFLPIVLLFIFSNNLNGQEKNATLSGIVVDDETGDPMIGAQVFLVGTKKGANTKVDGTFLIKNIPPGNYTLRFSYIGYSKIDVENLILTPGESKKINISMKSESIMSEDIIVTAKAIENTESALLKERQKSVSVSDAISSELISQTGSSDAADAMTKVTGVSVVDGSEIYVRGLGDRYVQTQLNGSVMASTDPDKNSASSDLVSSNFIENIVTIKSFTPDKPGNFTGGTVDVRTKSFPESEILNLSLSTSYNDQANFIENFQTYNGGTLDWLAMDDGSRDRPSEVIGVSIPTLAEARFDDEKAVELDKISKAFISDMAPREDRTFMNQAYNLSYGNSFEIFGKQFGMILGANYSNSFNSYANANAGQWQLVGNVEENETLISRYDLTDSRSTQNVRWGGMANFAFALNSNNTIEANFLYNRGSTDLARYLYGFALTLGDDHATYETRTLAFQERSVSSYQFRGEHMLNSLDDLKIEWDVNLNSAQRNEPNLRFFTNEYRPFDLNGDTILVYQIAASNYAEPSHFYRYLNEDVSSANLNFTKALNLFDQRFEFKFGGTALQKSRDFDEFIYRYRRPGALRYEGDADKFFSDSLVGFTEKRGIRNEFANYIVDETQPSNSYWGEQSIYAAYLMTNFEIIDKLKFIGGVRLELTDIDVTSKDSTANIRRDEDGNEIRLGQVKTEDLLPSINLIYEVAENMNLRASYGKTVARPNFRELAPFPSFDYIGSFILNGNPELEMTRIDNYDLRWEWFFAPGKIIAASVFYKRFENPIEIAIVSNNNQTQFQNVDEAINTGFELEARTDLGFLGSDFENIMIGGNYTYINSEVDIPEKTLVVIQSLNPNAPSRRPMQGQSPFLFNFILGYKYQEWGTEINLSYNIFGDRLSKVSLGGTPDVYEYSRQNLDIVIRQRLIENVNLTINLQNLLNPRFIEGHTYRGRNDYYVTNFSLGRTYSIGFNYSY